jgi:hypothetical protein
MSRKRSTVAEPVDRVFVCVMGHATTFANGTAANFAAGARIRESVRDSVLRLRNVSCPSNAAVIPASYLHSRWLPLKPAWIKGSRIGWKHVGNTRDSRKRAPRCMAALATRILR